MYLKQVVGVIGIVLLGICKSYAQSPSEFEITLEDTPCIAIGFVEQKFSLIQTELDYHVQQLPESRAKIVSHIEELSQTLRYNPGKKRVEVELANYKKKLEIIEAKLINDQSYSQWFDQFLARFKLYQNDLSPQCNHGTIEFGGNIFEAYKRLYDHISNMEKVKRAAEYANLKADYAEDLADEVLSDSLGVTNEEKADSSSTFALQKVEKPKYSDEQLCWAAKYQQAEFNDLIRSKPVLPLPWLIGSNFIWNPTQTTIASAIWSKHARDYTCSFNEYPKETPSWINHLESVVESLGQVREGHSCATQNDVSSEVFKQFYQSVTMLTQIKYVKDDQKMEERGR